MSRCRPINGFTPAHSHDGHVTYAHNTGEVNFWRRHPLQLASTLGFILNKRAGNFPGLSPEEKGALHECLTWLRQPGNNPVCFFGQDLEDYDKACKFLMDKVKRFLPEGSTRARIRATSRVSKWLQDGSLGDTLGDEARGMVVIDFQGLCFLSLRRTERMSWSGSPRGAWLGTSAHPSNNKTLTRAPSQI